MKQIISIWRSKPLRDIIASLLKRWKSRLESSQGPSAVDEHWLERHPNPWPILIEKAIHDSDAIPVCHRCFTPHGARWFCEGCGSAIGPYNNLDPYLYTFSLGESARAGVGGLINFNVFTITGYLLTIPLYFLPFYLYRLRKNYQHKRYGDIPRQSRPDTSKQITTFRCISCHVEMSTWSDNEGLVLRCNSCKTENIVPSLEKLTDVNRTIKTNKALNPTKKSETDFFEG